MVMIGHVIGSVPDGRMKTYLRYFTFVERGKVVYLCSFYCPVNLAMAFPHFLFLFLIIHLYIHNGM